MRKALILTVISLMAISVAALAAGGFVNHNVGSSGSETLVATSAISIDQWIDAGVMGGYTATVTDYNQSINATLAKFYADSNAKVMMTLDISGAGASLLNSNGLNLILSGYGINGNSGYSTTQISNGSSIPLSGETPNNGALDKTYSIALGGKLTNSDVKPVYQSPVEFSFVFASTVNWH